MTWIQISMLALWLLGLALSVSSEVLGWPPQDPEGPATARQFILGAMGWTFFCGAPCALELYVRACMADVMTFDLLLMMAASWGLGILSTLWGMAQIRRVKVKIWGRRL